MLLFTAVIFVHTLYTEFDDDSDSSTDMSGYSSDEDLAWSQRSAKMSPTKGKLITKPATSNRSTTNASHYVQTSNKLTSDVGGYLGMDDYMKHMDKELAATDVGKSFVREERTV